MIVKIFSRCLVLKIRLEIDRDPRFRKSATSGLQNSFETYLVELLVNTNMRLIPTDRVIVIEMNIFVENRGVFESWWKLVSLLQRF